MIDTIHSGLFLKNSLDHQMHIATVENEPIEIDNTMLHSESFQLEESICSDDTLLFGSCEASCVRFRVSNIINALKGKQITVDMTIEGEETPFRFGTYKVLEDKPTADRSWRDVTAYDAMFDIIHANVTTWYNGLSFPMTLKQFRDSFFNHLGITQETVALANDSMTVIKTVEPTELSGKQVVNAICEINGTFGHIGRDNKFHYIEFKERWDTLLPSNDLFPADNLYPINSNSYPLTGSYISAEYEDFETDVISGVRFKRSGDDGNTATLVGTANNVYSITDNFLVFDKNNSDLEIIGANFLSKVCNATYRPFKAEAKGNPCLEVGDNIRLNTSRMIINSFLWKRTLSGIQALRDTIETDGTEKYEDNMNSLNVAIAQLQRADERQQDEIDDIQEDIGELEISLQRTEEGLEAVVTRVGQAESAIRQTAHTISMSVNGTAGKNTYAGITISLYDEDGNLLDSESGNIYIDGNVIFASQLTDGVTTISGNNIKTGKIDASLLNLESEYGYQKAELDSGGVRFWYGSRLVGSIKADSNGYIGVSGSGLVDENGSLYTSENTVDNKIRTSETTLQQWVQTQGYISDIPNLPASKITSGQFDVARLPDNVKTSITTTYNSDSKKSRAVHDFDGTSGHYITANQYDISTSDIRLKENISKLSPNIKQAYLELEPITFNFKRDLKGHDLDMQYGFSAQKTQEVFAKYGVEQYMVWVTDDDEVDETELKYLEDGKKLALQKDQLHAMHVYMIQEQQKEINELKQEINELKNLLKEKGVIGNE